MKRTWKVWLSFLLSLSLLLTPFSFAGAAGLSDVRGHWAEAAIEEWHGYGVVNGYEGLFRPDDSVTRAEFAVMLDQIMKYEERGNNPFSDVSGSEWYAEAVIKLNKAGVMHGSGGKALPLDAITRQEAAVLLVNAFGLTAQERGKAFVDQSEIADWAQEAIAVLSANHLLSGYPDGSFRPKARLTRAEAVILLDNVVERLVTEPGTVSDHVDGNLVVNTRDVVLKDMVILGDLFIAQGVGDGDVTLDNVDISGSVIIQGGGEHSIIFNNVNVAGALIVKKYDGKVRIVATGNTAVSVTKLESGGLLVTRELTGGGFETVEISAGIAEGQEIILEGSFNTVINHNADAEITVQGTIKELIAQADTNIKGEVTIDKVTALEDVKATVNDEPAQTAQPNQPGQPAQPSTGGGGGSDPGNRQVSVTGISIDQKNISLQVGDSLQLSATVSPPNATNRHVIWSVSDNSTDVVTIDGNGLLQAVGIGSKTIVATSADGGKTDQTTVTVTKGTIRLSLAKYEQDAVISSVYGDIVSNSESLIILKDEPSWIDAHRHEAVLTAANALASTGQAPGRTAYAIVTLKDKAGHPIEKTDGFRVSVTSDTYSYTPAFGAGLAEAARAGSFILAINAGEPEAIRDIRVSIEHDAYEPVWLHASFLPYGTLYISGVEAIEGDALVDETIRAGNVQFAGIPDNPDIHYTWLRSAEKDGLYEVVETTQTDEYTITPEDIGQYIRVLVQADDPGIGGFAVSEAFGPIRSLDVTVGDVDPYFADGYPQAYLEDETIRVRFKLKQPAEVYMIVNTVNGFVEASRDAVLEGHGGDGGIYDIVWLDDWPYFNITEDFVGDLVEFDTSTRLWGREARIQFVIKDDAKGYVSPQPTTIAFEQEIVDILTPTGPTVNEAALNRAMDTLYVYFSKDIDTDSVPKAEEFSLTAGKVDRVSVIHPVWNGRSPYLKLEVSDISEVPDQGLELIYNGTSLRDTSADKVKTKPFRKEVYLYREATMDVLVGSDRKTVTVEIRPSWNVSDMTEEEFFAKLPTERVTVKVDGVEFSHDNFRTYGSTQYYGIVLMYDNPLPVGELSVTFDSKGLATSGKDPFPDQLTADQTVEIPAPGKPQATYTDGQLRLSFTPGFILQSDAILAAGFVIQAGGVEYALRGFIARKDWNNEHVLVIDLNDPHSRHFKQAVDEAMTVMIKYAGKYQDAFHEVADIAGALVPDFDYIPVTKQ